ncbi:hypothetical protein PDY_35130 [Photobacterium damselae subsp. damselae]|uniref:twin-arginine translocation signal domain-containing protein n=1 Tax=Photobacterium damselae TaxID=38293 RepID=UPI0021FFAE56|nr:sulfatase-like hydrolase/transferase [Photobacterium damselae]BDR36465.1 hypothetical protein PDY_35130 [Photobacterium damselae subsp. damselae]
MELSRRKFLKSTAAVGAVTATSSCFVQAEHSTQHPNVLFLAVDDLNDWIGALGAHPQVKTPNLDRLYKRSTAFRNAHCQVPVCGPSRTALLTGMVDFDKEGGDFITRILAGFEKEGIPTNLL